MTAIGVFAHVDAGKTTLSEALLYRTGATRRAGRVDHGDTLLDYDPTERRRGITIYAAEATFYHGGRAFTLLDTPGHADFAPEMERVLPMCDLAVLVVSATAGVQAHTEDIWRLCRERAVPTVVFVNKCDCPAADAAGTLRELERAVGMEIADMTAGLTDPVREKIAMTDDALLENYLVGAADDAVLLAALGAATANCAIVPAVCGSALDGGGVDELLSCMTLVPEPPRDVDAPLSAAAYKIRRDAQGNRLTLLKILSGTLRVRDFLGAEKVNELRRYEGEKYVSVPAASAGDLVAACGLTLRAGETVGAEKAQSAIVFRPLLRARVLWDDDTPAPKVAAAFRVMEDEEPTLSVSWNERLSQLEVSLMGEIQLEILRETVLRRFGIGVTFSAPEVLYMETIQHPVRGCGHYEPLRHYAEVHLLLAPAARGSGITFRSACSGDDLAISWQRLIETHVGEKTHAGALTGAPLTDVTVTLLGGRAHEKHTEGGDFREATYRAIRQALFCGESLLLEPYYRFRFRVESALAGRVMTEITAMSGAFDPPETADDQTVICGRAPVGELLRFSRGFAALTRGRGSLTTTFDGYEPCHDAPAVIARIGYDRERDTENPAGSVFCDHGAGVQIPWDEAPKRMHCVIKEKKIGGSL